MFWTMQVLYISVHVCISIFNALALLDLFKDKNNLYASSAGSYRLVFIIFLMIWEKFFQL